MTTDRCTGCPFGCNSLSWLHLASSCQMCQACWSTMRTLCTRCMLHMCTAFPIMFVCLRLSTQICHAVKGTVHSWEGASPIPADVLALDTDAALQQVRLSEEVEAADDGHLSHPAGHLPGQEERWGPKSMPCHVIPCACLVNLAWACSNRLLLISVSSCHLCRCCNGQQVQSSPYAASATFNVPATGIPSSCIHRSMASI